MVSLSLMARLVEAVRARRATDPRRRPGPAHVDRGRGCPRRHRRPRRGGAPDQFRRARSARSGDRFAGAVPRTRQPARGSGTGSSCSTACTATAAGSRGSPRRSGAATPTRPSMHWQRIRGDHVAARGRRAGPATDVDLELVVIRRWPPDAAVFAAARAGGAIDALEALGQLPAAVRPSPRPVRRERLDLTPAGVARPTRSRISTSSSATTSGGPLLVTENDYELGLYNGDTGVIVQSSNEHASAAFERGGELLQLQPAAARRRRDRLRDDDPQEPGLAVRYRRGPAPAAVLANPHTRAALHGRDAGTSRS